MSTEEKRRRLRRLVPSWSFLTRLRRPCLFSRKRKDRGEKSAWMRLVHSASDFRQAPSFWMSFHSEVTSRASWYAPPDTGVSNLQLVALERLPSIERAAEILIDLTFLRGTKAPLKGELAARNALSEGFCGRASGAWRNNALPTSLLLRKTSQSASLTAPLSGEPLAFAALRVTTSSVALVDAVGRRPRWSCVTAAVRKRKRSGERQAHQAGRRMQSQACLVPRTVCGCSLDPHPRGGFLGREPPP